jgi:hypothetical protein
MFLTRWKFTLLGILLVLSIVGCGPDRPPRWTGVDTDAWPYLKRCP